MLRRFLASRTTWIGVSIALLAGAAMEATGTVAGPLMIDRGISKEQVGFFFALPAVVCMALGALLGGLLSDRYRRTTSLSVAVVAMGLAVCGVALVATQPSGAAPLLLMASLGLAHLLFGSLTACWYALFMDLTDPALGGTQFSAFMGAVNACAVWSTYAVGELAAQFDYSLALVAITVASLTVLLPIAHLARSPLRPATA